jgi:hypothetical protein
MKYKNKEFNIIREWKRLEVHYYTDHTDGSW